MFTSYFGNLRNMPKDIRQVSICRNPPSWYEGEILYQTTIPLREYDGKYPIISTDEYRSNKGMVVVLSNKPVNKFSIKLLAPMSKSFNKYLKDRDFEDYTKSYKEEVLWRLDAKKLEKELGVNSCVLCWENDDLECHRSTARSWFNDSGVGCEEFNA